MVSCIGCRFAKSVIFRLVGGLLMRAVGVVAIPTVENEKVLVGDKVFGI